MKRVFSFIVKAGFILLLVGIGLLVAQNKNLPPKAYAQTACTTPAQVQNVLITFPYCTNGTQVGSQCVNTQANCTWDALAGASNYQVTITNSTTATQVFSQSVAGSATSQVFDVQDNNTYTCAVSAVNSCGTAGASNSFSLLCDVDALVDAPTVAPTTPPAQSAPPPPPPTGVFENTLIIGFGIAALLMGGMFLIFI